MRVILIGSLATILTFATFAKSESTSNVSESSVDAGSSAGTATANLPLEKALSPEEAARFAKQASFGPTLELVSHLVEGKYRSSWIDEQFTLSESSYSDMATRPVPHGFCAKLSGREYDSCWRQNYTATPMQMRFYENAIKGKDQLRQRVAYSISQILVTSDAEIHNTAGLAAYNNIIISNSFGNYRDIIKGITLNPYMGDYLDMADSSKLSPNENYARELMQLFTMGTSLLNGDGTQQLDASGNAIAAYDNADVKEIARALTGWTWSRLNGASLNDVANRDWASQMVPQPSKFDAGEKRFLGRTIPENRSQAENIDAVVDAVFEHPNTPPFVCKRLIQNLTAANPTAGYVARASSVFANNGLGVRGDMKATIRAILLDKEAISASSAPGKLKDPVVLITSLARAIGYKSDGYSFTLRDAPLGQIPFRAPSVFGFYPYDFPLSQGDGLLSPSSKLMTTSTMIARHNLIYCPPSAPMRQIEGSV